MSISEQQNAAHQPLNDQQLDAVAGGVGTPQTMHNVLKEIAGSLIGGGGSSRSPLDVALAKLVEKVGQPR